MNQNGAKSSIERGAQSDSHEEFLELCALSASEPLTEGEQCRLEKHLQMCPACSDTLKDFQRITGVVLPMLAPDFVAGLDSSPLLGSTEAVRGKLLKQVRAENVSVAGPMTPSNVRSRASEPQLSAPIWHPRHLFARWYREPALGYATAVLVLVALTASAYRLGERRGAVASDSDQRLHASNEQSLQQQVSALSRDSATLTAGLRERDYVIKNLSDQNILQLSDITKLKENQKNLQATLRDTQATNNQLSSERDGVDQQLKSTQSNLDEVNQQLGLAEAKLARTQGELDTLRQKRDADLIRLTSLEARIGELSERLKGRDDTIAQQQELLASDRDIRELMGARDLYLAEVYDTRSDGENEKPFGRVFFTKNKSLIFYAYDLDQQPGVKNASTFQAWGRRGPDRKNAVSLGIFYMDSVANKRWVLKVDDPQTLKQIDAVFVTVEPKGGSSEPSRNKLLFAWLRVPPNHP
jgi:hypothetical protein